MEIALQTCFTQRVEFAVLGRLEVRTDGEGTPLGGPKQRALLALLLLAANEVVPRDQLVDALWGERAPASAQRSLDSYVSRLRALLGPDRIERRAPGYLLRVSPGELDLERFERLLAQGRDAALAGDAASASTRLQEALDLWRGPSLADLLNEPFVALEAERLEERRTLALEERIDADLELGRGPELVPELEQLIADQPFRERPVGQLMLALYRAGRQAEALAVYQDFRHRLAEELGLEPGTPLRELEERILRQDPELLGSNSARRVERATRRRRGVAIVLAVAAAAISAAIGIVLGTRTTSASIGEVVQLHLTSAPSALIGAYGHLWTANPNQGTVSRVDLATKSRDDEIPVPGSPSALAAGDGSIWTTSAESDQVIRINPGTDTPTKIVHLDGVQPGALAFGSRGVWIAGLTDNELVELDPVSGAERRTIPLSVQPTALAFGNGTIWVASHNENKLVEVSLQTGEPLTSVDVGAGPAAVAIGADSVWVACQLDGTVWRIDPRIGRVIRVIPVGDWPSAIQVVDGFVWVADRYGGTVARIDPKSNAVVAKVHVSGEPVGLAAARNRIWEASDPLVRHRGGTLRLLHTTALGKAITSIDPVLDVDLLPFQADSLTTDGLVTYDHVPGTAGTQLVPDLARTLPDPTDGETTYTFRLQSGRRYSDGRVVRASDFRRSFERLFSLRSPPSPAAVYFTDIVGAEACTARAGRCDLSRGIVTDDSSGTVTFHLKAPDPSFLADLASRPIPPVPPGTPFRALGFTPIPGTGPYEIASASKHEIRYVRNPYFHEWSHAAQPAGNPNEIVTRFGLSNAAEIRAVEDGRADYSTDAIPPGMLPALRARFPGRLHPATIPTTAFYSLNTRLPPFDDLRVRRAVNFAIDRRLLVRLFGGTQQATPTCQILPPDVPGYRPYCPYTRNPNADGKWTAPDLSEAKRLVAASGTRGTAVRLEDSDTSNIRADHYVVQVLRRLGYRVSVRRAPNAYYQSHPEVFKHIQMSQVGWGDTPYGYFASWFSCNGRANQGWFCDPRIAVENNHAQSLASTNPSAAARAWARIDRQLVSRAAWLPLVNLHGVDFVSARVRNYQFNPYAGIIADQVWLARTPKPSR